MAAVSYTHLFFVHYDPGNRCFYLHAQLRRLLEGHFAALSEARQREIYLRGGDLAARAKDRLLTLRFYYASGAWERLYAMSPVSYTHLDVYKRQRIFHKTRRRITK